MAVKVTDNDPRRLVLLSRNPFAAAGLQAHLSSVLGETYRLHWVECHAEAVTARPHFVLFDLDSLMEDMPELWYKVAAWLPDANALCLQTATKPGARHGLPTLAIGTSSLGLTC